MTTTRPWRLGLLTLAAALIGTGCHATGPAASPHPEGVLDPYAPTPPEVAATALQIVQSLPSIEETRQQLEAAITEIKSTAGRLIPSISWESLNGYSDGSCLRPYEQTNGHSVFLPDEVGGEVRVSEQHWAEILEAAKQAAAKLGATDSQAMKDGPGSHDVGFHGPAGLFIKVAYGGNLVVSGFTGCRLPHPAADAE